jgi:leucyl-tRNA synthetase
MVLAEAYYRDVPGGGREWIAPSEVSVERDEKGRPVRAVRTKDSVELVAAGMGTMSKSKNNGVDPQAIVERYGADAARLFMMFAAPPEQTLEWSDAGIDGMLKFLKRLWRIAHEHVAAGPAPVLDAKALTPAQKDIRRKAHQTLLKMSDDIGRRYSFNTAIAAARELVNALQKFDDVTPAGRAVRQEALTLVTAALSPIVPHICHEIWFALGHSEAVIDASWPQPDPGALQADTVTLVVQVNGKLRGNVQVAAGADAEAAFAAALAEPNVQKFIGDQSIRKKIHVPDKLVNFVV